MPKPRSGKQLTQAGALVWVGRVSVRKNVRGSFQPETSSRSITLSNDSESAEHTRAGVVGAPESPRARRAVDGFVAGVLVTALSRGARRGISDTGDGPATQGWWYDAGGLINSFLP